MHTAPPQNQDETSGQFLSEFNCLEFRNFLLERLSYQS